MKGFMKRSVSVMLLLAMITGVVNVSVFAAETKTFDGVLICANCKQAGPVKHTVQCCLMDACAASGYGILVAQPDKTYKFYAFDDEGDALALTLLKDLQAEGVKNYITVKVTGKLDETAGKYDWSFGEKGGTIDYQGTISGATIEYDGTHAGFTADAVEFPENITVEISDAIYTGVAVVPTVSIKDGAYTLKEGFDYNVACTNNVEVGTANITITGVGAYYMGKIEKTFEIKNEFDGVLICANCKQAGPVKHTVQCCLMDACAASGYGILVAQPDKTYKFYAFNDEGDALALALLKDLQAEGVKNYITVKVTGKLDETAGKYDWSFGEKGGTIDYQGTISGATIEYDGTHAGFTADAVEFPENITVEISDAIYTGVAVVPTVSIKDGAYTLKEGFDYNVACTNNVEVGTANITITGAGAYYKGKIEKTFEIKSKLSATDKEIEDWAVSNNVITADFVLDNNCTRAQAMMFLWNIAGKPETKATELPFSDVDVNAEYFKAVLWAWENGITNGTGDGTTFSPDMIITRAQAVTFLHRAEGKPAVNNAPAFNDLAPNAYYADAVEWAAVEDITNGTGEGKFSPDAVCTNRQIVTFVYRLCV